MRLLSYVYIPEYKGIKDIEIVVDPHYHCHYDHMNKNMSIEKMDRIPEHFWGRGVAFDIKFSAYGGE